MSEKSHYPNQKIPPPQITTKKFSNHQFFKDPNELHLYLLEAKEIPFFILRYLLDEDLIVFTPNNSKYTRIKHLDADAVRLVASLNEEDINHIGIELVVSYNYKHS